MTPLHWIRANALLAGLIILAIVFGGGVYAGRRWFPRIQTVQVDRRIVEAVPVPGETKVVTLSVPGPVQLLRVPVEVTRYIDRPGQDRIVTVTQPVDVPLEIVREQWPQTITVRVGSVLTKEYGWATPIYPDLLIGQVMPGVYAVPQQEGWKVETVATETKVSSALPRDRWRIEISPGVAVQASLGSLVGGPALAGNAAKDHVLIQFQVGKAINQGWFGTIFAGYRF